MERKTTMRGNLIRTSVLLVGLTGCGAKSTPAEFTNQHIVCFSEAGDTLFQTDRINEIWAPDGGGFFGKANAWHIWYDSPTERTGFWVATTPGSRYPSAKKIVITGTCILREL